jgi:hypothetical protein
LAPPDAAVFAFALSQGSEFAFVLLAYATSLDLLASDQNNLLIAIVAISMALSPLLFILHNRIIAPRFARLGAERSADVIDETDNPFIIAGFGRFGMAVSRLFQAQGFGTTVLDLVPRARRSPVSWPMIDKPCAS